MNDRVRMTLRVLKCDADVVLTPLYAPDEAIAEIVLGEHAKLWKPELVRQLEREGLPPPRRLLGAMRYLPSVFDFFARREGLRHDREPDDGPENFGAM